MYIVVETSKAHIKYAHITN